MSTKAVPMSEKPKNQPMSPPAEQQPKTKKRKVPEGTFKTSDSFFRVLFDTKAEAFTEDAVKNMPIHTCFRKDKAMSVLKNMTTKGFLSAPVLNQDRSWFGMVTIDNLVFYVVTHFGDEFKGEEGKTKDFWGMWEEHEKLKVLTIKDVMEWPHAKINRFHPIHKGFSALSVVENLARHKGLHRVPVIDDHNRMWNFVTQSQVIKWLAAHKDKLGDKSKQSLVEVARMGKDNVLSVVGKTATAYQAFKLMVDQHISGIAIVDEDNKLTGHLSMRDLKVLGQDCYMFWRLNMTVHNFVLHLRKEYQARDKRPRTMVFATPETTISEAVDMLAGNNVHRVFIVEDNKDKQVIGVLSLKDLLMTCIDSF